MAAASKSDQDSAQVPSGPTGPTGPTGYTCPWHGQPKDNECQRCQTIHFLCGCEYHEVGNTLVRGHAVHEETDEIDPDEQQFLQAYGPSVELVAPTMEYHGHPYWDIHSVVPPGGPQITGHHAPPNHTDVTEPPEPQGPVHIMYRTTGGAMVTGTGLVRW